MDPAPCQLQADHLLWRGLICDAGNDVWEISLGGSGPGEIQTVVAFYGRRALGGKPGPSAPLSLD